MLAVATLWRREVIRFVRQRSRLVGALAQPLVFWLLLGGGLSPSFRPPGAPAGASYLAYLYPGILALVLLFTAIFATISTVEDRHSGFLQGVLVAPVSRTAIVVGQALGGTTLAGGLRPLVLSLGGAVGFGAGGCAAAVATARRSVAASAPLRSTLTRLLLEAVVKFRLVPNQPGHKRRPALVVADHHAPPRPLGGVLAPGRMMQIFAASPFA